MIARNDYGTSGDTNFFRLTGIKKVIHCAVCHLVKKCGMRSLRKRGTSNSHRERETGIEPVPAITRLF